jgi:hypothetical protein
METIKPQSRNEIAEELVKAFDSKNFKTLSEPVRVQILKFLIRVLKPGGRLAI